MSNDYDITMSEAFVDRISKVIAEEDNADSIFGLRAGLTGGGCNGMQYSFSFAELPEEGDVVIEDGAFKVVIDPISIEYMKGSTFDYKKSIEGEQVVVRNPNVQRSCGCGSSVSV
jgi:iron-sulfur cluster insertion protein